MIEIAGILLAVGLLVTLAVKSSRPTDLERRQRTERRVQREHRDEEQAG